MGEIFVTFKIANSNFSYKAIKRYTHNQNKENRWFTKEITKQKKMFNLINANEKHCFRLVRFFNIQCWLVYGEISNLHSLCMWVGWENINFLRGQFGIMNQNLNCTIISKPSSASRNYSKEINWARMQKCISTNYH